MSWTDLEPGQGDPDGVLALAAALQADADDADLAARTLRSVQDNTSDAVWRGSSADAFRDRIDKLPGHLDRLQASYAAAAAGLRGYAASVRQLADDAVAQQRMMTQSRADADAASVRQAAWTPPLDPMTGQPDLTVTNPHTATVAAANASVRKARAQLLALADRRRTADHAVIGSLKHAHSEGIKNRHWWQQALETASNVLVRITMVLMVVALVAIVVLAIVQPELIPGLLLLAGQVLTGLSAAQLAVDGTRKATGGNVSWGTLGMSAVGLLPGIGGLGDLARGLPALDRGLQALRESADSVRGLGIAGGAFVRSLGNDLKATRYAVRLADTGAGTSYAGIERQGKTAGQLLSAAKAAATSARADSMSDKGFVLLDGGSATRQINYRPAAADPQWGLTKAHLAKHFFGSGPFSLTRIDPAGTVDIWTRHLQELAGRPPTTKLTEGIIDIVGSFPRTDGVGTFRFGIRLAPTTDGSYDLITLLTRQHAR